MVLIVITGNASCYLNIISIYYKNRLISNKKFFSETFIMIVSRGSLLGRSFLLTERTEKHNCKEKILRKGDKKL